MPVRIISATGAAPLQNLSATTNPTVNDDLTLGYSAGSTWRNTITSVVWQCITAADGGALWVEIYNPDYTAKINSTATTNPGLSDDSTQGYSQRSWWLNNSTNEAFICLSAAPGAAHWEKSTLTIDELGSMATQNANAVAITGGTISGAALTPASVIMPVVPIVSAAGTTNLDATKSDTLYVLTGTATQTFVLPETPAVGTKFRAKNLSTGALTIRGMTAERAMSLALRDGVTASTAYAITSDDIAIDNGVKMDFGSPVEITGWSVFYDYPNDGYGALKVQYSTDGSSWTTAAHWNNYWTNKNAWNSVSWASVGAKRYWRLVVDAVGYGGFLSEFKLTTPTGDLITTALPDITNVGTGFNINGVGDLLDSASTLVMNTGDSFELEYVSSHLWAVRY